MDNSNVTMVTRHSLCLFYTIMTFTGTHSEFADRFSVTHEERLISRSKNIGTVHFQPSWRLGGEGCVSNGTYEPRHFLTLSRSGLSPEQVCFLLKKSSRRVPIRTQTKYRTSRPSTRTGLLPKIMNELMPFYFWTRHSTEKEKSYGRFNGGGCCEQVSQFN